MTKETPVFDPQNLAGAAALLRAGGVLAYPTEAVFGLGCDPADAAAVARVFALKRRPADQGFLLIAASVGQLDGLVDWAALPEAARAQVLASWPGAHTWILPRLAQAPVAAVGGHSGLAVRVTAHPPAAALCRAFGGAIVSTSANLHGQPPARTKAELLAQFGQGALDGIVDAPLGGLDRPTPIRDALTGQALRT